MKAYFKGFLKGAGILSLFIIYLLIVDSYMPTIKKNYLDMVLVWAISVFLVYRNTKKYNLSKSWGFMVFLSSALILPFFYGHVANVKTKLS